MDVILSDADAAENPRQFGIAHLGFVARRSDCADSRACGDGVNPPTLLAVEATNGNCIRAGERDDLRLGHGDARPRGGRHGRMLDERRIDGLTVEELDNPRLATDVDQRFGLRATETATGTDNLRLRGADGLRGFNLGHRCASSSRVSGFPARGQ